MGSPSEKHGRRGNVSDLEPDYGRHEGQRSHKRDYHRRGGSNSDDDRSDRHRMHDADDARSARRRRPHHRDRSVSDSPRRERKYRERYKERSRSRDHVRSYHRRTRSRSPSSTNRKSPGGSRSPAPRKARQPLPSQDKSFTSQLPSGDKPVEKQKPNFKPTGLLAKEANTVAGTTTVLKYHEPPEARKPSAKEQWRLYVFKKRDLLDTIHLHQRSVWLMGRDQKVTDLLLEHPSISKQHAVIQFRHITTTDEYGDRSSKVSPYLIDLESANGTKLNGKKVDASRFVELVDQDVISFGDSEREYVMMLPSAEK